jgi:hypothetical protein
LINTLEYGYINLSRRNDALDILKRHLKGNTMTQLNTYLQVRDLVPSFKDSDFSHLYQDLGVLSGNVTATDAQSEIYKTDMNKIIAEMIHEGCITRDNVTFWSAPDIKDANGKSVKFVYAHYLNDDTSGLVTKFGQKHSVDEAMKQRRMITEGWGKLTPDSQYTFFDADCMNANERQLFLTKKEQLQYTELNGTIKTQYNRIRTTAMKLLGMKKENTSNVPLNEAVEGLIDRCIKKCEDPLFPAKYDANKISEFLHKAKNLCRQTTPTKK